MQGITLVAEYLCVRCNEVTQGIRINIGDKKLFKCSTCKTETEITVKEKKRSPSLIFKGTGWGGPNRA